MSVEKKDTQADQWLAEVDAKIAALQTLRASIIATQKAGVFLGGGVAAGAVAAASGHAMLGDPNMPTDLPKGALLGKSIPAAIKLYMSVARRKLTIRELATALKEGGVESSSGNFENIITGSLNRLKVAGEILRFPDGWGLAEWYPAHLRGSGTSSGNGKKKRKAKKSGKAGKIAKTNAPEQKRPAGSGLYDDSPSSSAPTEPKKEDLIMQLFKAGRELSSKDVTSQLGMRPQTVTFLLGKLAYKHKLEKTAAGNFRTKGA